MFLAPKPALITDPYGKSKEALSSGTDLAGPFQYVKAALGIRAKGRRLTEAGKGFQLREVAEPYVRHFGAKNENIGAENLYLWGINPE